MILNLQFFMVIFLIIMHNYRKSVPAKITHKGLNRRCVISYKTIRSECIAWTSRQPSKLMGLNHMSITLNQRTCTKYVGGNLVLVWKS